MEQNVWYIDMCESPICFASHRHDVLWHSVTFFGIASPVRLPLTVFPHAVNHRVYVHFQFFFYQV